MAPDRQPPPYYVHRFTMQCKSLISLNVLFSVLAPTCVNGYQIRIGRACVHAFDQLAHGEVLQDAGILGNG